LKRFPFVAVITAAALLAAAVLFLERMEIPGDKPATRKTRAPETLEKAMKPLPPGEEYGGRKIAVIIDDIGFDLRIVEELAGIKAPIAFAVLPLAPHAAEAAERLHSAGKEILLHLPMEPHSYPVDKPGKGALFADMTDEAIRKKIAEDLAAVPHVSGVNNHMGSRFMEDEIRLAVMMQELAKRGLFFVDSRTTPGSRGREAAAKAGVRFAARAVFIDHTRGYSAALENLTHLPRLGRTGTEPLLMIGHPHPETVRALRDALAVWQNERVQAIPVSAYLARSANGEKFVQEGKP
jgi:polysaccharide deacetylase 2 family uncharacterized protein YibQ